MKRYNKKISILSFVLLAVVLLAPSASRGAEKKTTLFFPTIISVLISPKERVTLVRCDILREFSEIWRLSAHERSELGNCYRTGRLL